MRVSNVPLYREAGLDDRTLRTAAQVVLATLAGEPATRTELGARPGAEGLPSSGLALGTIMMWAELECLAARVCSRASSRRTSGGGPARGGDHPRRRPQPHWPSGTSPHTASRLMSCLRGAAHEARDEGVPVMRAMVLEFPDDPGAATVEGQYMLGGFLLVAPVMSEHGEVTYYVPEARWTHLLSRDVVEGPRWVRERHGFDSLPLLVREGAVLPLGSPDARPENDHRDGVTLEVYEPVDGSWQRVVVQGPVGEPPAVFEVERTGPLVRATTGSPFTWRLAVVRGRDRAEADGAGTLELAPTEPAGGAR